MSWRWAWVWLLVVPLVAAGNALAAPADSVLEPVWQREALPGIGLEPLTPGELQELHRQALVEPVMTECVGWFYLGASTQPVGVFFSRYGSAVKFRGAVRAADGPFGYGYDQAKIDHGALEFDLRVVNFARGFSLHDRRGHSSPEDAVALYFHSSTMRIIERAGVCAQAHARCRKYRGTATWWWGPARPSGNVPPVGEDVPKIEVLVEDMCPATTEGLIEGPWRNQRGIGSKNADRYNRLFKGIAGNPPLRDALK